MARATVSPAASALLLLCSLLGAWMPASAAISCRGVGTATTDFSVPVPAGVQPNDLLLTQVVWRSTATPAPPVGWTLLRSSTNDDLTQALFYRIAGAAEPTAYGWTTANTRIALTVAFGGVDPSAPFIASLARLGGNRTAVAPSLDVAVSDAWLVGAFAVASGVNHPFVTSMPSCTDGGQTGAGPNGSTIAIAAEALAGTGATGQRSATADTGGGINNNTPNIGTAVVLRPGVGVALDHIRIEHGGSAVTCEPATITLRACADATCSSLFPNPVSVTLSPAGGWSSNPVTFTGSTTVTLSVTTPATVTLAAPSSTPAAAATWQCLPSCQLTFADTGFVFDPIPTQTAGVPSAAIGLRAVRKADDATACTAALGGSRSIEFASQCVNPTTCAGINARIDGTVVAANPAAGITAYTPVTLVFDGNARANFTLGYADVGALRLAARTTLDSGAQLAGQSNTFVVRPADLSIDSITGDGGVPNPAAADAGGPMFIAAGRPFAVRVSALAAGGTPTPNFGRELAPETVRLAPELLLPAGGVQPGLLNDTLGGSAFAAAPAGRAIASALAWHEVGIIRLTARLADGDYLGSGDVVGTPSARIGRFVPDHFNVTVSDGCLASGVTYADQPFDVSVVAMSAGDVANTQNYAGAFARDTVLSVVHDGIDEGSDALTGHEIAATAYVGGVASTALHYVPDSPQTARVLHVRAVDGDSVSSEGFLEDSTDMRSARLRLVNIVGDELQPHQMPVRVESWQAIPPGDTGWLPDGDDRCTVLTDSDFTVTGVATISAVTFANGDGSITLQPSAWGNADVEAELGTLAPWLQFDWNGDGTATNPRARAGFGLNPGRPAQIFRREVTGSVW